MPLRPTIYPFARRRSVTDATFENPTSFVDQEITDVRMPGVARIGKLRQLDNFTRNFFFRSLHTLPNVLDDVPVVVASSESHRRVMPAWILAKQLLRRALRFDEILPVESRDCAQAGDTVSDGDLSQCNAPVGSRRRFLCTRSILGDPLLKPDQRREIRLV